MNAAPSPTIEVSEREAIVDGEVEIGWAKGTEAGTADLKITVRARVETINRAEALEATLAGATCVFAEGYRDDEPFGPDDEESPISSAVYSGHVQRTSFPEELNWIVVGRGDTGPLDDARAPRLEGTAKIRSLTLTASNGTVTLSLGVKLRVPIARLSSVVALDGQKVRITGRCDQADLFEQEPEAGKAEDNAVAPPAPKASRRKRGGITEIIDPDALPPELD